MLLPVSAQADQQSTLASVRREIEQREARAADYREEADGLLEELDGIDRERSELRRSMRRLRRYARTAEQDLAEARVRTAAAAKRMDGSRARLEARLVSLYKFSSQGGVRVLYSARDFQSFARGRQGLTRILEQDRRLFAGFREAQIAWQHQRDLGLELLEELAGTGQELARREDQMRQTTVERRNAIALLRSRSRDELRAARELREAAERLERAIAKMPRSRAGFSGPGLEAGALAWPAEGPVRLSFGRQQDPEFGTETLRTGIEIEAELGEPVRAVAGGRVLFAGWFRGFGQLVILDHVKGSVTVSGYLDELETASGDWVDDSQTIGRVGETGSISGPGLYFEIRHMNKPVDPLDWLTPR